MRRNAIVWLLGTLAAGATGCASPAKPIFETRQVPIEWPKPPDAPRIRYLGQLTGEESLHAARSGWTVLGEAFTGPRPKLAFSTPTAVAVAGSRVFVADGQNHAVYSLDLESRAFKTIGTAAGAPLIWPADVIVIADRLVVADSQSPGVHYFDLDGNYQWSLAADALTRPCALAWDAAAQSLWVLDAGAHRCAVFDARGALRSHVGQRGDEGGAFNFPAGLATVPGVGVAVADAMNFRVQLLGAEGRPISIFGKKGDGAGDFALPRDVAVDSEGHLYVLDNQFENVQIFDRAGRLLMAFGEEGRGPGQFYLPSGITIDEQDRIWIADTYNRRVQVFAYLPVRAPVGGDS